MEFCILVSVTTWTHLLKLILTMYRSVGDTKYSSSDEPIAVTANIRAVIMSEASHASPLAVRHAHQAAVLG